MEIHELGLLIIGALSLRLGLYALRTRVVEPWAARRGLL